MKPRSVWLASLAAALVVVLLGVASLLGTFRPSQVHVTAFFERTTGLYAGDDVRVIGVKIGAIDSVTAEGDRVRVQMHYDTNHKVPASAMAAIMAPNLVGGRYIQLAPPYRGGPRLTDGATIPLERTAVPLEWDQTKAELTRLSQALGPNNAHDKGALNAVINGASRAFAGNGQVFRDSLGELSRTAGTLASSRGNLFATARNLNDFVTALNESGDQITAFSARLAAISRLLDDNRGQLGLVLSSTDRMAQDLTSFVRDNSERLGTNVHDLTRLTRQLSDHQVDLANLLHLGPTAAANVYNSYDPSVPALTGRLVLPYLNGIANLACQSTLAAGGTFENCKAALGPLLDQLNIELPVGINPVQQTGTAHQRRPGEPDPPLPLRGQGR